MLRELTYKELYDILGEALSKDEGLQNQKAVIMIGTESTFRSSTVKGLKELHDKSDVCTTIQGAWYNGKVVEH